MSFLPGDLVFLKCKELGYPYCSAPAIRLSPGDILIVIEEQESCSEGIEGFSNVFSPFYNKNMSVISYSLVACQLTLNKEDYAANVNESNQ